MEEFLLKNRKRINSILVIGLLVSLLVSPLGLKVSADPEDEDGDITVSASVTAWLALEISNTELDLGELVDSAGDTHRGEDNTDISVGTNHTDGWTLQIAGLGDGVEGYGLHSVEADHTISSVTERNAVVAGTEGYGLNAEDIHGVETVTVPAAYLYNSEEADEVGPIRTVATVASFGSPMTTDSAAVRFRVGGAAAQITPAAEDYEDTITVTATVSP